MFYLPKQQNQKYSQNFRKLVNRALCRVRKQDGEQTEQQKNNDICFTIQYENNMLKKRKKIYNDDQEKRNLLNIKQINNQASSPDNNANTLGLKQFSYKIHLPKLQTPKLRTQMRCQDLSNKFIRRSDKEIAKLLKLYPNANQNLSFNPNFNVSGSLEKQHLKEAKEHDDVIKNQKNTIISVKELLMKKNRVHRNGFKNRTRKLKSQCIQNIQYLKEKQNNEAEQQQITPWALNSTSNYFNDNLK